MSRDRLPAEPPESRLDAADYQAVGAFRFALRKFLAFSEAAARSVGLSAQQHQALLAIKAHAGDEPMSIGELADSLLIKHHSAVGLVARLAEHDLVVRRPSARDGRKAALDLTDQAERLLGRITEMNLRELHTTAPVFRDLLATLKRIDR